jgi:hypothetical protein
MDTQVLTIHDLHDALKQKSPFPFGEKSVDYSQTKFDCLAKGALPTVFHSHFLTFGSFSRNIIIGRNGPDSSILDTEMRKGLRVNQI